MLDFIIGFCVFFVIYFFILLAVVIFGSKVSMKIFGVDFFTLSFGRHAEMIFIVSAGLALITPIIIAGL